MHSQLNTATRQYCCLIDSALTGKVVCLLAALLPQAVTERVSILVVRWDMLATCSTSSLGIEMLCFWAENERNIKLGGELDSEINKYFGISIAYFILSWVFIFYY